MYLSTSEDAEPHEVLGATATLLRVRLALAVELQCDLGIQTDTEIVVHHTFLFIVLSTMTASSICQSSTKQTHGSHYHYIASQATARGFCSEEPL